MTLSRWKREKIYYQDQSIWTVNDYEFLYFNFNKAIFNWQEVEEQRPLKRLLKISMSIKNAIFT